MANADIGDVLKAARDNMQMVAEAEARLAAAGQVSLATWEKQAAAVQYLTGRMKLSEEEEKKTSTNAVTLSKAFSGVQKSIVVTAATLTGTAAELHHLTGAASPGLLKAWDGSLQILQARIGGALIPAADAMIDTIMDMADWFEGLSDGSKQVVAGGALAIPILFGLSHAIQALKPGAELAIAALKKLSETKIASSLGATGGIAAGAATAAAIAFWNMDRQAGPSSEETRNVRGNVGSVTVEEMRALRFTEDQIRDLTSGDKQRMQQATDAIIRQDYRRTDWQHFFHPEAAEDQKQAVASVIDRVWLPGAGAVSKEETDWRKQVKRQAMRVSAVQQENRPMYSPLAEARKQLQLSALGKNQFEQALLKEQRKHRQEEIKRLDQLIRQGESRNYCIYGD